LELLYDEKGNWKGGITKATSSITPFSRLLYRGNLTYMYRASVTPGEKSVATLLAKEL